MKNLSKMKFTKNQKYAMYFGGAVLGTIIIVKIIKGIIDGSKGGDSVVTQTVYTDKYLSGLPLGVDKLTWASKVPSKYLPKYDAIALANSDATYKAKAVKIQTLLNQRMEALFDGYPALVTDGKIGAETTKAMIKIANEYNKLNDLVPLNTKDDLDKWATFFNVNSSSNTNDNPNDDYPWWNLK
jgi:hypothetical protein